jgi:iron(III) transport system permease protein
LAGLTIAVLGTLRSGMQRLPRRVDRPLLPGRWGWIGGLLAWGVLLLVIGVPVANLVYKAGLRVEQLGADRIRLFSWNQFVENVIPLPATHGTSAIWRYRQEFGWTISLAVCVATIVLLVAIPLAALARRSSLAALPAALVMAVSAAFSGPLAALAIVGLRSNSSGRLAVWLFDQTIFAPVVATSLRALPLGILICWVAFVTLDRRVLEAAALDGAGTVGRFIHVVVPQRTRALALAWMIAFTVAYGDLSSSILVVPPGIMTLPMRVFDQLHAGVDDRVAAICLTSLFGFLLLAGAGLALLRPWWPANRN